MSRYSLLAVLPILLATTMLPGQVNGSADSCKIQITSPRVMDHVSESGNVSGTAKLTDNSHIWVLAHRKGLALWWPQPPGDIAVEKDNWSARVYYGSPEDVGSQFEIVAVIVSADVDKNLRRWVDENAASGKYPPIPIPVSICQSRKTVVRVH